MKLLDEHSLRAIKNLVRTGPKDDKDAKYCEQAPYFWGGRCLLLKFPFHSVALEKTVHQLMETLCATATQRCQSIERTC